MNYFDVFDIDLLKRRDTPQLVREELAFIHTHSGKLFRYGWPLPEDVCIEDIAHALSRICRFAGHIVPPLYSVAEHSVRVSYRCDPKDALWGLLHDAGEAYCVDVPRPLKRQPGMEVYRYYEGLTTAAVCLAMGLEGEEPHSVKLADRRMLSTEQRDLFLHDCRWAVNKGETAKPFPEKIVAWSQPEAEQKFLERYYELTHKEKQN